jgi:hypothetical protein
MKRKFAVLTVLGALIALAVPASSMASMYPAGHKFEIAGTASGPKLTTSLGSCLISKITGTIPAAPANEEGHAATSLTAGTCSAGTSITLASEGWDLYTVGYIATLISSTPEPVVMRFSSLPGCKLIRPGSMIMSALWSNGTTAPTLLKSGFHAAGAMSTLTWANDGGSCGLAGKTESATFEAGGLTTYSTVSDLTSPTTPVIVGNNK